MWEVLLPLISFWMSFRVTPKKIDALLSEKSGAAQNNAEFAAPEAVRAASVQLTARAYKDLRDYMDEVYLFWNTDYIDVFALFLHLYLKKLNSHRFHIQH